MLQQNLFTHHNSVMLVIDPDTSRIVDANPAAESYYGWAKPELTRKKITEINLLTPTKIFTQMIKARCKKKNHFTFRHQLANAEVRDVEVYSAPINQGGHQLLYSIIHDITECKQIQNSLRKTQDRLESVIRERNSELEDIQKALDILLKHREMDKTQMAGKLKSRYDALVAPLVGQLKSSLDSPRQKTLMDILESSLTDLLGPLPPHPAPLEQLTPTEVQVAAMVKQGMTNKEIAQATHKSIRTISNHRDHIREKLGIRNRKINLRVHLNSLK
ncbi:MAG: LuxR C-terminal-related transcriptional regulator [Desulfobacterales bacterium]|nr:LuxR C-terminal-related transcriptional regulator [Desulfobacterales bacterium]